MFYLTPTLIHLTNTPSLLQKKIKSLTFILIIPTLTVQKPTIPTSPQLIQYIIITHHKSYLPLNLYLITPQQH